MSKDAWMLLAVFFFIVSVGLVAFMVWAVQLAGQESTEEGACIARCSELDEAVSYEYRTDTGVCTCYDGQGQAVDTTSVRGGNGGGGIASIK